jgi:uracil-DNA glycosylase family 4
VTVHPRVLARRFAAHLEHLRDAFDRVYIGASATSSEATATATATATNTTTPTTTSTTTTTTTSAAAGAAALRVKAEQWTPATKLEYLRRQNVGDCRRCGLCRTRTNIVFGVGNPEADLMFVGEAPGADEDKQGEPFVGRAGQRLDVWLRDLGLSREDVYIANVLKCRPPGNRDPRPEEVDACSPFLSAQIRAIRPKVLVALGRHAGMLLSRREDMSLGAMRRTRLAYDASGPKEPAKSLLIPLVVTYHPAYVLRQEGSGESGASSATNAVMQDLRRALDLAHAG